MNSTPAAGSAGSIGILLGTLIGIVLMLPVFVCAGLELWPLRIAATVTPPLATLVLNTFQSLLRH